VTTPVTDELYEAILEWQTKGRSLYQLSKKSGVSGPVISRFMSGEREGIRIQTIDKLATALGMALLFRKKKSNA
tara:strand:- start:8750 stop:8971 length:222 start_codon:yes stop_codon:yes gene_type:complete